MDIKIKMFVQRMVACGYVHLGSVPAAVALCACVLKPMN